MKKAGPPSTYVLEAPTIIIQQIVTRWHKATRGGVYAALRNRLPRVMPLPEPLPSRSVDGYIFHLVAFEDSDRYQRAQVSKVTSEPLTVEFGERFVSLPNVRIFPLGGVARVDMWWRSGAPRRNDDEPITDLFTLRQGQWGCVEYNRRLSYQNGTRYYECMVFNIGLVSTLPHADVFVDAQPVRRYASIARLW